MTDNALLRSAPGLGKIWFEPGATIQYYPLVFTSFWIERHLWGLAPAGYHVVNVVIHAASAFLVYLILRGLAVRGAAVAALLFALHPVHVESVAWITERKNVLSGLFYLAASFVYLRASGWLSSGDARPSPRAYAATLGLFACALLSKTVTATLPAALLLVIWWKRGSLRAKDVIPLLPMFALGAALGATTAWLERTNVGAVGPDWALSFVDRLLIAGRAPWFYLSKLLVPLDLTFIYPRWRVDAGAASQWIYPVATVAATAALWLARRTIGRGPLMAWLFFCGTLFPALGFVNTYPMRYSFVADHFQYLASLGPLAVAAVGLTVCAARFSGRAKPVSRGAAPRALATADDALAHDLALLGTPTALVGLLLLTATLLGLTWRQARIYHDLDALYADTLAKNPSAWMAHNNLGVVDFDRGDIEKAQAHYVAALREKEDAYEVHNNLGKLLLGGEQVDEAIVHFRRAIEINPKVGRIYSNLGEALERKGQLEEAFAQFDKAVEVWPTSVPVRTARASALARNERFDEAIAEFERALALDPENGNSHNNLANALAQKGRVPEAVTHYQEAVRLNPSSAGGRLNFANTLYAAGRIDEALEQFRRAVQLEPRSARGRYFLARALAAKGQLEEAIAEFRNVLSLAPADADTHYAIGVLQNRLGRKAEAIEAFQAALAIDPSHVGARNALASEP